MTPPRKPPPASGKKVCTRCSRELPIDKFVKSKAIYSGRKARCKRCQAALVGLWRQKRLHPALRYENFYDPLHPRFAEFCPDG